MLHSSNCESPQQGSSIPLSRGLFPASRACFVSQISPPYCLKSRIPAFDALRQIPHPEKPIEDPQNEAGNPDCYPWHPAHTFNIKSRGHIALKSRILAFK